MDPNFRYFLDKQVQRLLAELTPGVHKGSRFKLSVILLSLLAICHCMKFILYCEIMIYGLVRLGDHH